MPSLDSFANKAAVTVDTTALGTDLLTPAEQSIANMTSVVLNPSTDIYLVDGTALGTVANSPFYCAAGQPYVINHMAGPLKAIAVTGTSVVKVAIVRGHA